MLWEEEADKLERHSDSSEGGSCSGCPIRAERSKRDIPEIEAGIKTINDILIERGLEPKKWGDIWRSIKRK